jgi:hypothetical protein
LKDYCGPKNGAYLVKGEVREVKVGSSNRAQVTVVNKDQTRCPITVFLRIDDVKFRVGDVVQFQVDKSGLNWTNIRGLKVNPVGGTGLDGKDSGNWLTSRMSTRDLVDSLDPEYYMVDMTWDAYGYRYTTLLIPKGMAWKMEKEAVYKLYFGGDKIVTTIEKEGS